MDKTAIKNFATWARRELIEKVTQKAKIYGIEKDKIMEKMDTALNGQILSSPEKKAREILISKIEEDGFDETIEEVAYTWFNRFIAIRFMEVNGYMPSHIRVFTSEDNRFEPQILSEAIHIDLEGLDREKVLELYNAGDKEEELFKYLFITQCNALNKVLPGMFQKINDYTELLLPDGLLRNDSVIARMVEEIPEEDWKEQVQIIGWLYQYYNEERRDEIINIYKGNISKEDIPAATQLFTPDWIVRYIVDNSLGKYWIERNPDSDLKDKLEFFITLQSDGIEYIDEKVDPRDLRILDNCVGSGHFLLYEFDLLMEIYKESGYREREAVEYILSENLYGLDIDERAGQLAYFSLMMKARSYNRRILTKDIKPNVYTIRESNGIDREYLEIFGNSLSDEERIEAITSIEQLLDTFIDGKNYGSILKVKKIDFNLCRKYIRDIEIGQLDLFNYRYKDLQEEIESLIDVAEVMTMKYHVVATNPPYLNKMNTNLKKYVDEHYKDYKTDLFSVFMYRNLELCKPKGYCGFMTPYVWMFIKSYEKLREYIINNKSISSLIQMEYSAFKEATVPICAFVLKNGRESNNGLYFRLSEFTGGMQVQKEKILEAIDNPDCGYFYETSKDNFAKIPGMPIAYWASDRIYEIFEESDLSEYLYPRIGMVTGNTSRFLRLWHEVPYTNIGINISSNEESIESNKTWFPYQKGGAYRKWYGNNEYVVDWEKDGYRIKYDNYSGKRVRSHNYNGKYAFLKQITWTKITSSKFSSRFVDAGYMFDDAASIGYIHNLKNLKIVLGFLNTKISNIYLNLYSETINFLPGHISNLPFIFSAAHKPEIDSLVEENIKISKIDWDSYETSWDFEVSPLLDENKVVKTTSIEKAYEDYKDYVNSNFEKLKQNEERLNEIFIEIYGLENELTPEVSDKDITVAKIFDDKKDIYEEIKGNRYVMTREDVIKNFLSYFIGCAMGRYSLDEDGLIFAGGDFDPSKYKSFKANEDGIIALTDEEYFEDDIVELFIEFLKVTFGEENLNENLDFIASELKGRKNDSSREKIRNYFLNDFYKDHCKIYKKLPIYWQYDSGKNGACRGLFYLHRYNKDTFANIRINHVFELQDRYKQELSRLEELSKEASGNERIQIQKQIDGLKDKIIESQQFEEKVQHIADSYIEIDLDDGVKENYKIFKDVLAKI